MSLSGIPLVIGWADCPGGNCPKTVISPRTLSCLLCYLHYGVVITTFMSSVTRTLKNIYPD